MRDTAAPGSHGEKDPNSHGESEESPEPPKDFKDLNSLKPFPRSKKYSNVPGRSYLHLSDMGEAIVTKEPVRKLWFCSEPLNIEHTRRPASIQLITHSHAKLVSNENTPSKAKNDAQNTSAEGREDMTKNTTPEGYTWFEIRICETHELAKKGSSRTNDKGELLEWLSHRHSFQSEDEEWI
ncbi:unnamed protein product [Fusarium equiseti]|uniref:Uncharacterized protein n=1 Tax=Fusarium equiseti TaxID=61235 RepID=A0A8J2J0E2_FUSEQ|nr:unnamed protein product [Fusarium equiseti]